MGIVTSRSFKLAVACAALVGAAFALLFSTAAPAHDADREQEVRGLVKQSLRWSMGGIERGAGHIASWHGVDTTFPKLVVSDQPILVRIVRDPKVSEEERLAARMLLSCYGEDVRGYVKALKQEETNPVTRIYWDGVLSSIDMNARNKHVCR